MTPARTRFLRRGDRIELLRLQSFGPSPRPHPGDRGVVHSIDGDGGVRVNWDSGAQASVDPSAGDRLKILETVKAGEEAGPRVIERPLASASGPELHGLPGSRGRSDS